MKDCKHLVGRALPGPVWKQQHWWWPDVWNVSETAQNSPASKFPHRHTPEERGVTKQKVCHWVDFMNHCGDTHLYTFCLNSRNIHLCVFQFGSLCSSVICFCISTWSPAFTPTWERKHHHALSYSCNQKHSTPIANQVSGQNVQTFGC